MKIVRMDDMEWWIGPSLEACLAAGRAECGADCYPDDGDPYELSEEQLQRLTFVDEDGTERSFADQLAIEVAAGGPFPRMFAAEDY